MTLSRFALAKPSFAKSLEKVQGKPLSSRLRRSKRKCAALDEFISAVGFFTPKDGNCCSLDVLEVYVEVEVFRELYALACSCYMCEIQRFTSDKFLPQFTGIRCFCDRLGMEPHPVWI